jgi:hypothetical protein
LDAHGPVNELPDDPREGVEIGSVASHAPTLPVGPRPTPARLAGGP